jgi:hypothetical protein
MECCFITGSQAYGCPTKSSDVDIVVLMKKEEALLLESLADDADMHHNYDTDMDLQIRFGKLNLIITWSRAVFAAWRIGTSEHRARHKQKQGRGINELDADLYTSSF